MSGLDLSFRYYAEVGRPMLEAKFPFLLERIAAGRVGEGSECFGLDDAFSQDHDFGPGFCIWLEEPLFQKYGSALSDAYWALPSPFAGFSRPDGGPFLDRVGIFSIPAFYRRFLGTAGLPETEQQWFSIPQEALAMCTNGNIYTDPVGAFSAARQYLLAYYPEQVRLKKLAAHCAIASQAGQYNYDRCVRRGDHCAAIWAIQQFLYHYQAAVFLLNRRYQPYGKLSSRALCRLPLLGQEAGSLLSLIRLEATRTAQVIEQLCSLLADALRTQGLSYKTGSFLLDHGAAIQSCLTSRSLSSLPLMSWKTGWLF